ncbi:MAG: SPFH domain-containing protein [Rhizobiaceae bacterium]
MLEVWIGVVFTAIVVIAVLYVISIWVYKRAPANMGFIRTGWGGTKICLGRGALVLPVFHEVSWISLETMKLIVNRSREQAVLTADKIRVDVVVEMYAHVGHSEEALLIASRSLGEKTFDSDAVRNLLEAKVIGAIRSYAATKTLMELHEDRNGFASAIEEAVIESYKSNGLALEEVTIVSLEQSAKEFFNANNIFDAEGLKIITEITSDSKRKVHDTEKKTTIAIRQKDLDTQLELLEIERKEAVAQATQDKDVANEQAQQLGEKQIFVLDRRRAVEEQEIANEVELERQRTAREMAVTEERKKREQAEIQRLLAIEEEEREKEIALISKARERELTEIERNKVLEQAEIERNLRREEAEKSRDIDLTAKERERRQAEIALETEVQAAEEAARDARSKVAEETSIRIRKRALETRKTELSIEQEEAVAEALQDKAVAEEKAQAMAEKQRVLLERRKEVEQDEIATERAIEEARIQKEAEIINVSSTRETAEIRKQLTREAEERDRDIALVAKAEELEKAEIRRHLTRETEERDREIVLVGLEEKLRMAEVAQRAAIELGQKESEIRVIVAEQEREKADIQRFQARELQEREREIALVNKTRELEQAEIEHLRVTAEKAKADHDVSAVRVVADAEQDQKVALIGAETEAGAKKVGEQTAAEVAAVHVVSEAEARKDAAAKDAEAILARARANSEAQRISAEGIKEEAAARGRAEAEIEELRAANARRMLEAEAGGIEAKAEALAKYNEAATFLELAKLHIEAERDVHIDQAKAMGTALSGAQIRMFGGDDGTVNTIRGMFTQGFSMGELLEGVAESLPAGIRERFARNGVRGIWGTPGRGGQFIEMTTQLGQLVRDNLRSKKSREVPFADALALLEQKSQGNEAQEQALNLLKTANEDGIFDKVPFDTVWALLQATAKATD